MALKSCKECGSPISPKATMCPRCGAPQKPETGRAKFVGCLVLLALFGTCVGWPLYSGVTRARSPEAIAAREAQAKAREAAREARASEEAARSRAIEEEHQQLKLTAQTFTASQVVTFYAGNEVAGDEALKGRWFKVSGVVESVGKDILGTPYLLLRGPQDHFRQVQCVFTDPSASGLSSVRPGQAVVVFGRGAGLMMNVQMKECEFD